MSADELVLRPLELGDETSFLDAVAEFRSEDPPWNFALGLEEGEPFDHYIRKVEAWTRGEDLPSDFVPNGFYVGIVRGEVVGRVSVRFRLNESLLKTGGHIGYGVRKSQRRLGYATRMLQLALPIAHHHGIDPALVTCDVDNVGSRKVIERCGGVLESITNDPILAVQKMRFWVATNDAARRPKKG
jgi:predicted acetyltransferase